MSNTQHLSAPRNEECSPRAIGAALQQAPCIIRNRPIKAFDQAPLPLHSWPCYRRALAFLSSPPTWRLSLQSLPSSPLSSSPPFLIPRQPRRPPGDLPSHFPTGSPYSPPLLPLFLQPQMSERERSGREKGDWKGRAGGAVRIEVRPRIFFSSGASI